MNSPAPHAAGLHDLFAAAAAAPSMHNTQPWRFAVRPGTATVEIHAVLDRALRAEDADGRGLHLSVGAALFNVRCAVAHRGWSARVRLLPDPAHPDLLAEVDVVPHLGLPVRDGIENLYGAIRIRHSNRRPFTDRPIPGPLRVELTTAADREQALLHWPDVREARRLLALGREAELRNITDPARAEESRAWVRAPGDSPYGVPAEALGPRDTRRTVPSRDLLAAHPTGHRPAEPFEAHPQLAVLATWHDRRIDWLRAGQAMQRVLLLATRSQLSASMLHQAVEWPDLRRMLRPPGTDQPHVQILLRLGYGPQGVATPRAPVHP